jgi:hypothetical protein
VKGDVTTIACDAWLCPTDRVFSVTKGFRKALGLVDRYLTGYEWRGRQAIPFKRQPKSQPLIVLGKVGQRKPSRPEEVTALVDKLVPVITEFVEVAVREVEGHPDRPTRLALPLIGTGHGGLSGAKGETIRPLLTELWRLAAEEHVDFILCTDNPLAWSAVQSARSTKDYWALNPDEEQVAQRLADEARARRLVLFIGAGVSRDAGLPDWRELLERLPGSDLTDEQRESLGTLDPRDHATLIQRALGGREAMLSKLLQVIGGDRPVGLTHALLASLGSEQAITTNFDNQFERACAGVDWRADVGVTVLPYGRVEQDRPWLLKLHGSLPHGNAVEHRDDIVLTRSDYMSLIRQRSALFGIVQALLVTKHLLFVGYSLGDEDFHQLADEIRTAIVPATADQCARQGTVLAIQDSPWASLWDDLLDVVRIGNGQVVVAARRLQIFLDRVAYLATPHHAFLLDESFGGLLDADERRIAARLRKVQEIVTALPDHATAAAVRVALERFGAPRDSPNSRRPLGTRS